MQCPGCQFENMPSTPSCVRCGASLSLATTAISVIPPRASDWRKAFRRWLPLRPTYYPIRDAVVAIAQSMGISISRRLEIQFPPPLVMARMILPGWANAYLGHTERGRVYLCAWLLSLLVGIVAFGSTIGAIALGLTFAVHIASILDLLLQGNQAGARSLTILTVLAAAILLAIYLPVGRVASRFVSSRQLIQTTEPFTSGDVVLFRPRAYTTTLPQPGDVVLYRNTPFNAAAPRRSYRRAYNRIEGEWVDRVVAGPGSTVRWQDGTLLVNGEPSPFLPLNPQNLPSLLEIEVPYDACCILPTTNPYLAEARSAEEFRSSCIVPRSHLVGKVIVRNYPIWRWWWVR